MRAAVAFVVVVVVVVASGCASVEDHVAAGRFDDACVLLHEDPGLAFWREPYLENDLLRAAVVDHVHADLGAALDEADVAGVAALGAVDDRAVFAALRVVVDPGTTITVQEASSPFIEGPDALALILAALPPIADAPPLLLPPGPLSMPPAPDPTPPAPASSSSSSGGFFGAMVELVTLPFRIVGEIASEVASIPFDLFGVRSPFRGGGGGGSSSTTTTKPPDPRLPGEAILPPEAWEQAKQKLTQEHDDAVAAVEAARAQRLRTIAPVVARLGDRCRATATAPCTRLVLLDDNARGPLDVRVGLGSAGKPCGLDDALAVDVDAHGLRATTLPPWPEPTTKATKTATTTTLPEAPAIEEAAKLFEARKKGRADLDDLVCRVDVSPRWKRLLPRSKGSTLSVRLATGSLAGQGTTVDVPPALRFFVGKRGPIARGDHLKIAVAGVEEGDAAFFGGVVGVVDELPLRLSGESITVECR